MSLGSCTGLERGGIGGKLEGILGEFCGNLGGKNEELGEIAWFNFPLKLMRFGGILEEIRGETRVK